MASAPARRRCRTRGCAASTAAVDVVAPAARDLRPGLAGVGILGRQVLARRRRDDGAVDVVLVAEQFGAFMGTRTWRRRSQQRPSRSVQHNMILISCQPTLGRGPRSLLRRESATLRHRNRQRAGAAQMADEGGVAAVDRALSILDAFTDDDGSAWPSSSKRTGLYKSTVLRLAKSLEKFGYRAAHRGRLVPPRLQGARARLAVPAALPHRRTRAAGAASRSSRSCTRARRSTCATSDSGSACTASRRRARCATRSTRATACRSPSAPPATCILAFSGARGERYDEIRKNMYCRLVRRARPGDRGGGLPGVRPGAEVRRRAQRLRAALPHRGRSA